MAEQEQQEFTASWEETPEYGNNEPPVPAEETPQIEAQVEETVAEEVEEEVEETESDTDWQDRYKNLEQSHSRRGNELHKLKQEQDAARLEKLEMQQRMLELEQKVKDVDSLREQVDSKPDPLDESIFYTDEEKQVLKDYPELLGVAKKMAQREAQMSFRKIDTKPTQEDVSKYENMQKEVDELKAHIRLEQAKAELDRRITPDWRVIDENPKFFDYVNKSPLLTQAMNHGTLDEKAEVFKMYMDSEEGQKILGKVEQPSPTQTQNDDRRKAAQGLVRGQTRDTKPTGSLSIDEEWAKAPEYQWGT